MKSKVMFLTIAAVLLQERTGAEASVSPWVWLVLIVGVDVSHVYSTLFRTYLDKDDLAFYRNALRMRNHNLGIAAVAYLRRVVENKINDVLDVLAEAAQEHDFAAEELKKIKEAKSSYRFDDKIEYAAKLLPPHLRPKGKPNPIDVLHGLASEGLHSKSEEECIDIFDKVRKVFEYVFGNLNVQIEEARAFVKSLEGLQSTPKSSKQKADRS